MLTRDEIIAKARDGVVAQGRLAKGNYGGCYYINLKGTARCGVGHLLAGDDMRRRWEGRGWSMANVREIIGTHWHPDHAPVLADLTASGLGHDEATLDLLSEIQNAHDRATDVGQFVENLRHV